MTRVSSSQWGRINPQLIIFFWRNQGFSESIKPLSLELVKWFSSPH